MTTRQDVLEYLDKCTLLDLSGLIDNIKEQYNITEAPQVIIDNLITEEPKEEQTEFDVILSEVGQFKLKVIKEVRNISGFGLKESKVIVDNLDTILTGVLLTIAEKAKAKLETVGAKVEIK